MSICEEQPELVELLKLLIQAQLLEGYVFFVEDLSELEPKQTNDVERILEAICLEKPMLRFLPSIHAVANDTESDTCDNG